MPSIWRPDAAAAIVCPSMVAIAWAVAGVLGRAMVDEPTTSEPPGARETWVPPMVMAGAPAVTVEPPMRTVVGFSTVACWPAMVMTGVAGLFAGGREILGAGSPAWGAGEARGFAPRTEANSLPRMDAIGRFAMGCAKGVVGPPLKALKIILPIPGLDGFCGGSGRLGSFTGVGCEGGCAWAAIVVM